MPGFKLGNVLLCLLGVGCVLSVGATHLETNARPFSFSTLNVQLGAISAAKGAELKVSFVQLGDQQWPDTSFPDAMELSLDNPPADPPVLAAEPPSLTEVTTTLNNLAAQLIASDPQWSNCALEPRNVSSTSSASVGIQRTTVGTTVTRTVYNFGVKCVAKGAPLSSVTITPLPYAGAAYGAGVCTNVTARVLPTIFLRYSAVAVPVVDPNNPTGPANKWERVLRFSAFGNITAVVPSFNDLSINYKPPGFHTVPSAMDLTKANTWTPTTPVDSSTLSNLTQLYSAMANGIWRHNMFLFGSHYPCVTAGTRAMPPLILEGDAWNLGSFGWNGEKGFSPMIMPFPSPVVPDEHSYQPIFSSPPPPPDFMESPPSPAVQPAP